MSKGFTLLEVVIVLALIAIGAALTIPMFRIFDRLMVKTEVDVLYLAIKSLEQKAITSGKAYELVFNEKDNSYTVESIVYHLHSPAIFGIVEKVTGPPSNPQKIITKSINFPDNKITIFSDGVIQAGSVYITDKNKKYLYALTCPVADISYLRRYVYNGRWTLLS